MRINKNHFPNNMMIIIINTAYFVREKEICIVFTFIVLIFIEKILESLLLVSLD